jgi:hypothetical protein
MQTTTDDTPDRGRYRLIAHGRFIRDGLLSFVVLLLAFAAFDDITTDKATSFRVEYTVLATCAVWFGSLAVRLLRLGYRTFGMVSLAALAGALWGQSAMHPDITPGFWPGYLVTIGAFLWFLALAISLLVLGSRAVMPTPASRR